MRFSGGSSEGWGRRSPRTLSRLSIACADHREASARIPSTRPQGNEPPPSGEVLLLSSLVDVEAAIAFAARRQCLHGADAEEFGAWVKLRLIEDDYRILRAFQGKSSLKTYLTTVVLNLARDYRIQQWGRWRPSAAAERMGTVGVQLETLLDRDGRTLEEAIQLLRERHGVEAPPQQLREMAARLPAHPRRRLEGEEALAGVAARERTEQPLFDAERSATLASAGEALEGALRGLPVEDRLVLKLHFIDGLTVAAIARGLGLEQRRLYTRLHRNLAALRVALEAAGLDGRGVLEATGWAGADLAVDFGLAGAEIGALRPSNPRREQEGS